MGKAKPKRIRKSKAEQTKKALDNTAFILRDFSEFLESIEHYRKAPQYSKTLVQNIFETWAETSSKEQAFKHQAGLIKGFAEFLS
jgi:N-glycosylase/DNA lyase